MISRSSCGYELGLVARSNSFRPNSPLKNCNYVLLVYSFFNFSDDSDSEEEQDKSNKCVLVWEVSPLHFHSAAWIG